MSIIISCHLTIINVKAKKSFGQHFLKNLDAADRIVTTSIQAAGDLPILEVGPGKGVLTDFLIQKGHPFRAIDADRDMIAYLDKAYPTHLNTFILSNVLKFPFEELFENKPFVVMGNFPYNISSQIVFKIMENEHLIPYVVGMFQKEVADRIIAPSGNKVYGAISVLVQSLYTGKKIMNLTPGSFNPPPKVHSSVISLERRDIEIDYDWRHFRNIVKATFGQRRKMIRNTLKSMVDDKSMLEDDFFNQRPEQLNVNDFVHLAKKIPKIISL